MASQKRLLLRGDEWPQTDAHFIPREPCSEEEDGDWEKLPSSSSPRSSASSRSPSTPKCSQTTPYNLKPGDSSSSSRAATSRGRYPTLPVSSFSSVDEPKMANVDFSSFPSNTLSRGTYSPLRPHITPGNNIKKTKRKDQSFQRDSFFCMLLFVFLFFLFDWWVLSSLRGATVNEHNGFRFPDYLQGEWRWFPKFNRPLGFMYGRLLGLAAHALAEGEMSVEPRDLWEEPHVDASAWRPCANESHVNLSKTSHSSGYILISANGGLNQQRVAICNGVAVAYLLNATLVLPRFLFSSVWQDESQFGDIYQDDFFIDYLKDDVKIVKQLPVELQSLDLEAIGSLVTDMDVMKEAKPSFYIKYILPKLLHNRVVHFLGFGHRLSFDPIPFEMQRLRCKCNFHALKFIPKIQRAAGLMVMRMREKNRRWGAEFSGEDTNDNGTVSLMKGLHMLVDAENIENSDSKQSGVKYLGLHLRFEIDMVAYSLCEFGGGDAEQQELEAYRKVHFPTLTTYMDNGRLPSAAQLREEGKCPLTPEEAVLMLVALGFKRGTRIFLAGAHIYGGQSRMSAVTSLYPNLVTKEDLLSPKELEPFLNKYSQLAALDFIGCTAADVFAMTDSGSQLASLVSGFRIYFGDGLLPTIRPNKRRLASIFSKNMTIEWEEFSERVRKAVNESKRVLVRPVARSVYRHPRCSECMCIINSTHEKAM